MRYCIMTIDIIIVWLYNKIRGIYVAKKHPFQVYLDDQQFEALKFIARQKEVPVAYIIRESVAKYLSEIPAEDDPGMQLIELGNSGKGDIAEKHDNYLIRHSRDR